MCKKNILVRPNLAVPLVNNELIRSSLGTANRSRTSDSSIIQFQAIQKLIDTYMENLQRFLQ